MGSRCNISVKVNGLQCLLFLLLNNFCPNHIVHINPHAKLKYMFSYFKESYMRLNTKWERDFPKDLSAVSYVYIIIYTLNNEYCGFIHSVGISFCGCIIIQSQGYITRGKSSHWNNKLTDIVDIWRLTEQQTESLQKLVFNEYWWNLTICTNWQNIFKYIFSNKFNYTEVKAVFLFLHNMSD